MQKTLTMFPLSLSLYKDEVGTWFQVPGLVPGFSSQGTLFYERIFILCIA